MLVLAAGMVAWVVVEIAFALHGWPGLQRYMYEAGGVMVVLAGVGVGWLVPDARSVAGACDAGRAPAGCSAPAARWSPRSIVARARARGDVTRARAERRDLRRRSATARPSSIGLGPIVARLGGASLLTHCGEPLTSLQYQSVLAWTLHTNVAKVGWKFTPAIRATRPIVIYRPARAQLAGAGAAPAPVRAARTTRATRAVT